jgi:phage terminase large subunit-like protein
MLKELEFQKKIGFEPHPAQLKILESLSRDKAICAGRRFGKSAISAYEALRTLIDKDKEVLLKKALPAKIWIVSPNYDLSQKVFEYLVRWYLRAFPSQTGGISYRPFPQIKTPRGSLVQCKSAENPTSLLGEEIDLLIVDEASRISKNVYETYLFPTTASRCGRTIFISTPFGKNWFYRKCVELKETDGSFQFKTTDNPNFPPGEWDRAKKILPEMVFKQEYEAQFLDDAASVFRRVQDIVANTKHDVVSEHTYVMGVDLGKHEDFTAITVIDRMNNHVVYFDRFNKIDYPFQKERILAVAKKYRNALITIDSTVVGEPIKEDLERMGAIIDDFKFSQKSKKELIEKLSIFIEQGNIHIPNEPVLLDELGSFGYQLSASGNILYAAPEGQHDDCVFSLALAVWGLTPDILHKQTKLQEELTKNYSSPANFI